MKLIIAGSRSIHLKPDEVLDIIVEKLGVGVGWEISEIVSGAAIGVDRSGEEFADAYSIKLTRFPAGWSKYGKGAGPKRNLEMAERADALLLIWDGKSKGSANMKARMLGMGKPVYEVVRKCA